MKSKSVVALLLKRISKYLLGFAAFALIAGCATPPISVYPKYKGIANISVSADTVSTMNETPAEDYLIPESQVFIGGLGGSAVGIGSYFGAIGAAIGANAARSRNESAVSAVTSGLRVKFDTQFAEALKRDASKFKMVHAKEMADIQLLPSARFIIQSNSRAQLYFRLTARFKDDSSGTEGIKNYYYFDSNVLPFSGGGWTDDNAAIFKEASNRALDRLAQVFLQDLAGEFRVSLESDKQQLIRWKAISEWPTMTSLVVREYPEYVVVVPMSKNQPFSQAHIEIVERSWVRLEEK